MTIKNQPFNVLGFCGKAVLLLVGFCIAILLALFVGIWCGEMLHDLTH